MPPIVLIALLIGIPILLIFLIHSNAAMVFMALCAGFLLTQFVTDESTNILSSFFPHNGSLNSSIVQLSLLYAPVLFTALFMKKSVSGAKALFNIIPAAAVGIVGALLAVPLLPGGVQHNIVTTQAWTSIEQYQAFIVSAAVLVSLLSLWFSKPKPDKKSKHKK